MDRRRASRARSRGARPDPGALDVPASLDDAWIGQGWTDVASVTLGTGYATTMAGLAVVHVAAAVADVVIIPGAPFLPLAPLATALALGLFWFHHLRRPRTGAALQTMLGLAFALTTTDLAIHLVVGDDPMYAVYLTLGLVTAGALVPQARWLLVSDVLAAASVAIVVAGRLDEPHPQQAVAATTFAIAVAHVLQRHAKRGRGQLQVLASALAHGALTDPLTGLSNRQGLTQGLEQLMATTEPGQSAGRSVAVLCFDVDGFKGINDDLGHACGDAVLVEVADRLRELVRTGDLAARLGGDEFAVVLADVAPAEADLVAERARLRLRGSAGVLDMPWSVSVGMVCATMATMEESEDLLRAADLRMYEDKRARRSAGPGRTAVPQRPAVGEGAAEG